MDIEEMAENEQVVGRSRTLTSCFLHAFLGAEYCIFIMFRLSSRETNQIWKERINSKRNKEENKGKPKNIK